MLDLTIKEKGLKNNIERAKAQNIILPTIDQQMHPEKVPEKILEKLKGVGLWDIDPVNLFRMHLLIDCRQDDVLGLRTLDVVLQPFFFNSEIKHFVPP